MRRLLLLRHAPTAATRRAAFSADEPLDEPGAAAAAALRGRFRSTGESYASPADRARETARLAGLDAEVEPALAECDFGAWAGHRLDELAASDPDGVRRWLDDPAARPHGGETMVELMARVAGWLDGQAAREGAAVAVTHGGPIRAAVLHALGAPAEAFWRVDAAPLSLTELHADAGRWRVVRLNASP
ncbi:MAG: histidine phosphatase family protein [Thermoleophilia bacterium]